MTEREKVIEDLKELRSYFRTMAGISTSKEGRQNHMKSARMIDGALALLKAQEPRVMTLEEVLATEVVYAEDIDKAEIIPVLVDRRAHDRIVLVRARLMGSPSLSIYPLISEYNKRWRCWTSRPTDEQRKAVKWG